MMNHLLLWASARGEGSLPSLRSEIARFPLEPADEPRRHYAIWDLARLGHLEIGDATPGSGWRVCPPVLAARAAGTRASAVLCGARTPALLDRIAGAASGGVAAVRRSAQPRAPDLVEVDADDLADLAEVSRGAGVALQLSAASSLLSAAGALTTSVLEPADMPIGMGWEVSRFSRSSLRWTGSSMEETRNYRQALFRFRSDYQTLHILLTPTGTWACAPDAGKYLVLERRHHAIRYSAVTREFRAAPGARPPRLIERALVVSSGRLPAVRDGYLTYPDVELRDARAAAARLRQVF